MLIKNRYKSVRLTEPTQEKPEWWGRVRVCVPVDLFPLTPQATAHKNNSYTQRALRCVNVKYVNVT